jgi:hypothetical protein
MVLPPAGTDVNLRCHTTFSYNAYGYSPSKLAWLAGRALGNRRIVDFDVLDGLDEFSRRAPARPARLRRAGGARLHSRVTPYVMNSPGEPGVSYHMGVGFPTSRLSGDTASFLARLRRTSEA